MCQSNLSGTLMKTKETTDSITKIHYPNWMFEAQSTPLKSFSGWIDISNKNR